MNYFLYEALQEAAPSKRVYKVIIQNSAVQSGQW